MLRKPLAIAALCGGLLAGFCVLGCSDSGNQSPSYRLTGDNSASAGSNYWGQRNPYAAPNSNQGGPTNR